MYGNNKANDFRRTWDRDEYERKAQERISSRKRKDNPDDAEVKAEETEETGDVKEQKLAAPPKKREMLKAREFKVDLESKVGKTVVISTAAPSSQAGGYYCEICDCLVKDSINYLDHINGKKHQRNLGMNMRVKRSTLDDVKARFEFKLKQRDETKQSYDIEERIKELKEEEEKVKEYRKEKRKEKKKKKNRKEESETVDDDDEAGDRMAAMMGFGSFGSSKKK